MCFLLFLFLLFCVVLGARVYAKDKVGYEILVDVEASKLWLIYNGEIEKEYACAGGKASTPSPIGTWKIISKAKWGEGFGGSWMGLNVPWEILESMEPRKHIRLVGIARMVVSVWKMTR